MPSLPRRLAAALAATAGIATAGALLAVPAAAGTSAAKSAKPIVGPDVSSYQHPNGAAIRWGKVHRAGAKFAIVKATEGTSYTNPWFAGDYAGAAKAGLVRGSYHFARPALPVARSARQQAQGYAAVIGNVQAADTLPPALDLEVTGGLTQAQLVQWAQDFLLELRRLTGRTPLLYTYPYFWSGSLGDAAAFARYPIWMASYSSSTPSGATLWQFTSTARLRGIAGGVDESRYVGNDVWPWSTISDGTVATPWSASAPGAPQGVWTQLAAGSRTGGTAVVHWLPGDTGTAPVTGYTVTASPGGRHVTVGGGAASATLTGLKYGRTYRFTVHAVNAVGTGTASVPTNAVTPLIPTAVAGGKPQSVVAGTHVTLSARLTRTDSGAPLAGHTVTLLRMHPGQTAWHKVAVADTDEAGSVSFARTPYKNTIWELAFGGGSGYASATATVRTYVRPTVTLTAATKSVPVGGWVHLTGVVAPDTSDITLVRQVYTDGEWVDTHQHKTLTAGDYRFAFRDIEAGTLDVRVRVAAAGGRQATHSHRLRITAS